MIGARIKCDHCGFIGEMAMEGAYRTVVGAPAGWATIHPHITIKGERQLDDKKRKELKDKIKAKTPSFHVCPECIFGKYEVKLDRLLAAPTNG